MPVWGPEVFTTLLLFLQSLGSHGSDTLVLQEAWQAPPSSRFVSSASPTASKQLHCSFLFVLFLFCYIAQAGPNTAFLPRLLSTGITGMLHYAQRNDLPVCLTLFPGKE